MSVIIAGVIAILIHGLSMVVFYYLIAQRVKREVCMQMDTKMAVIDANMAVATQAVRQMVDLKNTLANTNELLAKLASHIN